MMGGRGQGHPGEASYGNGGSVRHDGGGGSGGVVVRWG